MTDFDYTKTKLVNMVATGDLANIGSLKSELLEQIAAIPGTHTLEGMRVSLLGKKGLISALLSSLGKADPKDRQIKGALINGLKEAVAVALLDRKVYLQNLETDRALLSQNIDVTLPPRGENSGTVHPISQVLEEITAIFADLGFAVAEGPDVEFDDYNFTRLNVPENHPARQMQDTFYVSPQADGSSHVLRTHTSPVQVRTMLNTKPPIRIISPGRAYRVDSDATHSPMFHQVEALVVEEGIHLGHLKWTVEQFCKAFFEIDQIELRARPSFFPFTEPSLEWDMRCDRSVPGKITFGTGNDWLELGGSGMVHRKVLENCGIDSTKYQGFAFGFGLDRMAMLKYGMPDIRSFFESDLRWLKHYGFAALDIPTLDGGLSR